MEKIIIKDLIKNIKKDRLLKIENQINSFIEEKEKYSKSYFWSPWKYAYQRQNSFENDIDIKLSSWNLLKLKSNYHESSKNCYYHSYIFLNNEKKTITILKKIVSEIENKLNWNIIIS